MSCRILAVVAALASATGAMAGEFAVRVLDPDGAPVPDVVVFVREIGVAVNAADEPDDAIMDQRDASFVPHILVVQKGAAVEFPNSDIIAHHVYSFSRPNNFVLPLYKGILPEPIVFENDGVVTLGCNIHDDMLGYIIIVDTKVFGTTDEAGGALVNVDDSATGYEVRIWSPRIRDSKEPVLISLPGIPTDVVTFKLQKSLRIAHVQQSNSVAWDEY